MQLSQAQEILSNVLNTYSYDDFFNEIVGQKPLVLLGDKTTDRHLIIGDDPKKAFLEAYETYAPILTSHIHTPTSAAPTPHTVENAEEFLTLIRQYHQIGHTVRIPDILDISPRLSELTRALEVIIENPVGVVAFWSDNDAKAPVHYDEVDVIVIQLSGTKRWYVSDVPTTFPNEWKGIGEVKIDLGQHSVYDVEPGDLIYLPRGTAHTVHSTSESFHIAIGFVPVTTRDAIIAILDHLSDLDKPLRSDIGTRADDIAKGHDKETIAEKIKLGFEQLSKNSQSEEFIKEAMLHRRAKMILDLPKLTQTYPSGPITIDSIVKHNPLAITQLTVTPNILDVRLPGGQILIHLGAEESLRYIIDTPTFRIGDIPGHIGDDVRLALVDKFLGNGFLELA